MIGIFIKNHYSVGIKRVNLKHIALQQIDVVILINNISKHKRQIEGDEEIAKEL